ncbi:hypothetical protein Tco_1209185 [Tanacetum coccineum]
MDTSFLTAKIHDIECQMLEVKLVLVGDDGVPLNVDGQTTAMKPFTCFPDTLYPVGGNKVEMSFLAAKIHDIERQMLKGKLVLVNDVGVPLKPLNVDGQTIAMESFPCLSNTFDTP